MKLQLENQDVIRLLNAPMAEWDHWLAKLPANRRTAIEDAAVALAVRCGRLAAYTAARGAREIHEKAVVRQNKVAAALRKLFGFSYPVNDITF